MSFLVVFIAVIMFAIFFIDAISSSKYVQGEVSGEIINMIEEP